MPNYYSKRSRNNMHKLNSQQENENITISSTPNMQTRDNGADSLIIDDNTVYEVDQDCYEKLKKSRLSMRQDWNRR